ncbi:DUF350 domain-containing protein [Catenovulum sp. SM1970]|uniref:DUF350 domain-containing protein n=1 Tax=Marinifaba aquimaris TaxID=2741323 RepID=UPI001572F93B|nr:DUF350 domain-containing protein [Marinifaba aquimaris]NTS75922.1 DUF350 domain-containing protein [Marinifaba aquimaris]
MNSFNPFLYISPELLSLLAIDLSIAIALLCALRFLTGLLIGVNTKDELAKRDNFAFGISMAGSIAAAGIVLTGAVTGEAATSYVVEAIGVFTYGAIGIIFIKLGRILHDKIALNEISKVKEIQQENIAVAIVDAAASIATAIIVRSVLIWAEGLDIYTGIAVLSGFFVAQVMLVLVTRLRESHYAKCNQGDSLQAALQGGQIAVALRHAGHLIGTAMAVTAASYFLSYEPTAIVANLVGWFAISVVMALLMWLLTKIAKKLILAGINVAEEIDQQDNIGLAAVEMALVIAIAFVLTALMA